MAPGVIPKGSRCVMVPGLYEQRWPSFFDCLEHHQAKAPEHRYRGVSDGAGPDAKMMYDVTHTHAK